MQDLFFFLFSGLILTFGFMVVSSNNLIYSALNLIACLFSTAALFILQKAEFVALAQVLVYIGGILVFIIFTIFLTSRLGDDVEQPKYNHKILSIFILTTAAYWALSFFLKFNLRGEAKSEEIAKLSDMGALFLDTSPKGFIVPFEVISVLILSSMIGAIVIAIKDKKEDATNNQRDDL